VCEFYRYEDMKYAIKKLDDTKFKSHEVKTHNVFPVSAVGSTRCPDFGTCSLLIIG
jgi:hypothetical protein